MDLAIHRVNGGYGDPLGAVRQAVFMLHGALPGHIDCFGHDWIKRPCKQYIITSQQTRRLS
jgi:hypothetical protein